MDPLLALSIRFDEIIKSGFPATLAAFLNVAQRKSSVIPLICAAIIISLSITCKVKVLYMEPSIH